jgi:hypothetical protein
VALAHEHDLARSCFHSLSSLFRSLKLIVATCKYLLVNSTPGVIQAAGRSPRTHPVVCRNPTVQVENCVPPLPIVSGTETTQAGQIITFSVGRNSELRTQHAGVNQTQTQTAGRVQRGWYGRRDRPRTAAPLSSDLAGVPPTGRCGHGGRAVSCGTL